MSLLLLLTLCAVLGNSLALLQLLGAPPAGDLVRKLAVVTGCVLIAATLTTALINRFVLMPYELTWLRTVINSVVVAVIATVATLALQKQAPVPHRLRYLLLPLLISNGIVLAAALPDINAVFYSVAAAAGFALLLLMLTALQQRLAASDVPMSFKGSSILLITGSIIALALMGLTGLV